MTDESRPEPGPTDPRFLLANERTLLAWLRTALAFEATGLALVALRHGGFNSDWLMVSAMVSCAVGVGTALWAYSHWRAVESAIRNEKTLPRNDIGPILVLAIVVLATTGIIAMASFL